MVPPFTPIPSGDQRLNGVGSIGSASGVQPHVGAAADENDLPFTPRHTPRSLGTPSCSAAARWKSRSRSNPDVAERERARDSLRRERARQQRAEEMRQREAGQAEEAGPGAETPAGDGETVRRRGWDELMSESMRLLDELHRCSGSLITANSRRLHDLEGDADALQVARADVAADIAKYAHVSMAEGAECVRLYQEAQASFAEMNVCAACGLRDPEVEYHWHDLASIADDHWLVVDEAAYHG